MIYDVKKLINSFKKVKLLNKEYRINDIINFKEPLIHEYSGELITRGTITDTNKFFNPSKVRVYLADSTSIDDKSYCTSWSEIYSIQELEKMIKKD